MDKLVNDPSGHHNAALFGREHHLVFLVHCSSITAGRFCRFLYVEVNYVRLGTHTGHKSRATRSAMHAGGSVLGGI